MKIFHLFTYCRFSVEDLTATFGAWWLKFKSLMIISIMLAVTNTSYASQLSSESEQLIEDLQLQIDSTVAAIADAEVNAGNSVQNLHIMIDLPAHQSPNLGLVLDLDSLPNHYKVLSVTPGSLAESLQLSPGNQISAINGIPVNNDDKRAAFSSLEESVPGDKLSLIVHQNGQASSIETVIVGQYRPAVKLEIGNPSSQRETHTTNESPQDNQCGAVSVFFTPPETKRLHRAYISKIDDNAVIRGKESYRLKPGKHTIYLHELINDPFFNRRYRGLQNAKPIEIDIKANTSYYLAAKFIKTKAFKQRDGEYWQPVVWKVSEQKQCEL